MYWMVFMRAYVCLYFPHQLENRSEYFCFIIILKINQKKFQNNCTPKFPLRFNLLRIFFLFLFNLITLVQDVILSSKTHF